MTNRYDLSLIAVNRDVPEPEPGPGQICVRVLAAPANFPDVLMCQGRYGRVTFLP